MAALPDLSGATTASGYKVNGIISQYYTQSTASGDEVEYARWVLEGMWPASVTTTGFDLSTDQGSMLMTSIEFAVDLALPFLGARRASYSGTTPVARASST